MLRQAVNCVKSRIVPQIRQQSTVAESAKWDLLVGVQIERLPIITKTLSELERDYQEMIEQVEYEQSYKSDFELSEERDIGMAQLLKEGKLQMDLDGDVAQKTAMDLRDAWETELNKFQAAPRITDADKQNNLKSTDRKLDHSLTLMVEHEIGAQKKFILPQGKIQANETLYDAAQRIITEFCGNQIETIIYGRAPCGFYKYKYPNEVRTGTIGAKIFFYRAIVKSGEIDKKQTTNFEWLDKTELFTKIDQYKNYKKSLSKFII